MKQSKRPATFRELSTRETAIYCLEEAEEWVQRANGFFKKNGGALVLTLLQLYKRALEDEQAAAKEFGFLEGPPTAPDHPEGP